MNTGTGAGSQAGKQKRQGPTRTGLRYVLTLAFLAFGLCHVIQFPLRFRNVLRLRAALPQRPGPRLDCRRTVPPNLPWGKNPARREASGIPGRGENFNRPGGGLQGTPQARA